MVLYQLIQSFLDHYLSSRCTVLYTARVDRSGRVSGILHQSHDLRAQLSQNNMLADEKTGPANSFYLDNLKYDGWIKRQLFNQMRI